jgi:hypothetical protein
MLFQLPPRLSPEAAHELERSCIVGGPDNMPWPVELTFQRGQMNVQRSVDESGYVVSPWPLGELGLMMVGSATLMERPTPYTLLVELARGKVNQVRTQAADWEAGGLQIGADLRDTIHRAALTFGEAVCSPNPDEMHRQAQDALLQACQAATSLVEAYTAQVFEIRHQRQTRLDSAVACRLGPSVLRPEYGLTLAGAVSRVSVPLSWHTVEADEATYSWDAADALLDWAETHHLEVTAGPLIDFSSAQLPAWLWLWENDLPSMATFMCRYVEAAVRRYRSRIRRWHLTAASNWATVLGLSEDELLSLTFRLGEAARQVDPTLELVIGVSQPWGEYMALVDHTYSPFIFADTLIRSGLNLSALDIEVVMGVNGRGSYCRDLLEMSRLLDMYALIGVDLQVTLGYPASAHTDPKADPELRVGSGNWRGPYSPVTQGDWAARFAGLALCKQFVKAVQWVHFCDADPHQFPACGLVDATGNPHPALSALRALRDAHLGMASDLEGSFSSEDTLPPP